MAGRSRGFTREKDFTPIGDEVFGVEQSHGRGSEFFERGIGDLEVVDAIIIPVDDRGGKWGRRVRVSEDEKNERNQ